MAWLLFFMIAVFCIVSALIMPWINYRSLQRLEQEIERLQRSLIRLTTAQQTTQHPPELTPSPEPAPSPIEEVSVPLEETDVTPPPPAQPVFEQQFGARLPVWIGGIALALAGFFLVKYSLEHQLLTPAIRLLLGGLLGVGLLYGGHFIQNHPDIANSTAIAQSLSGAGIAVLYGVSFASARLYELVPMW